MWAGFTGIWIKSYEPDDAIAELTQLCQSENGSLMTWDIAQGLRSNRDQPMPSDAIAFMRTLGAYFATAFASCFFCFGLTLFSPVNARSKSFFCGGPTVLRPLAI